MKKAMNITDKKTFLQIQEEFTKVYPGLKIEFYKKEHKSFVGSPHKERINPQLKIMDITNTYVSKELIIAPDHTVRQVEEDLKKIFHLNAQIFRKSKDIWLQTSTTDGWSLEKQNRKGLHSMNPDLSIYGDYKSDVQ